MPDLGNYSEREEPSQAPHLWLYNHEKGSLPRAQGTSDHSLFPPETPFWTQDSGFPAAEGGSRVGRSAAALSNSDPAAWAKRAFRGAEDSAVQKDAWQSPKCALGRAVWGGGGMHSGVKETWVWNPRLTRYELSELLLILRKDELFLFPSDVKIYPKRLVIEPLQLSVQSAKTIHAS